MAAKTDIKPRSYPLKHAFQILGISETHGGKLVAAGLVKTISLGIGVRRISDDELCRLLREGISQDALAALRKPAAQRS